MKNYLGVREADIDLGDLTLFIGPNGAGKSTILDALHFLNQAVIAHDFRAPCQYRGGIGNLSWKGCRAAPVQLGLVFEDDRKVFKWDVSLFAVSDSLQVTESVMDSSPDSLRPELLEAGFGEGWWWSPSAGQRVNLFQAQTECSLAYASSDASFAEIGLVDAIRNWCFVDPSPPLMRGSWPTLGHDRLSPFGDNLAEMLYEMSRDSPTLFGKVVGATKDILGLPIDIEPQSSPNGYYLLQHERGLRTPVHQIDISAGTLRMLALMTALFGQPQTTLVGIEEPENYIHPSALSAFADHLLDARSRIQILVTTHSPVLLDCLDEPSVITVVSRDDEVGTVINREGDPEAVRRALYESGFSLGEYHQSKGFGG